MKKQTKIIIGILTLILIIFLGILLYRHLKPTPLTDAEKFHQEYTKVDEDNIFVYRDLEDIIDILQHGTGIVYLGFPECPWCQAYVPYLNEVAKEQGFDTIYYYNIKEDREKNTESYQKVVSILEDYLEYNNEGKKRIFVPDVTFVQEGEIVGHDNETSMISSDDMTPEKYWTKENIKTFKEKLISNMEKVNPDMCTKCNQ